MEQAVEYAVYSAALLAYGLLDCGLFWLFFRNGFSPADIHMSLTQSVRCIADNYRKFRRYLSR